MFLKVDNNFVRQMKNHVMEFFYEPAIGCILGTNGYIWIHSLRSEGQPITLVERTRMAALRNAIIALEKSKVPIFRDTIVKALDSANNLGFEPKAMLIPANVELICESAKELVDDEISTQKQVNVQQLMKEMQKNDFN